MGGFIFDSSELSTEAAALSNVYAEYAFNLMSGAVNPDDVLPTFLSKLGNIEDTFYPLRFFQNICKLHRTTGIYKQNNRHTSAV